MSNISNVAVGTELGIEETSGIDIADTQYTDGIVIMDSSFKVELTEEMLGVDTADIQYTDGIEIVDSSFKVELEMDEPKTEDTDAGNTSTNDVDGIGIASAQVDVADMLPISAGNLSDNKIAKAEITGTSIDDESVEIGTDIYIADAASYRLGTNDVEVDDEGVAEADLLDLEDIEVATVFANALDLDVIEGNRVEVLSVEVPEGGDDGETIDVSAMFADVVEVENITSGTPDIDAIGTRTPDLGRIESRFIDKVAYRRYAAKALRSDGVFTPTDTLDSESVDDTEIIFASEVDAVSDFEESVGIDAADEERMDLESTGAEETNLESSRKYSDVSVGSEPIPFFNEAYLSQNDDPNLSLIEEEAPSGRDDIMNSVEIAMENTVTTSDMERDDHINALGDDSGAIPFDNDRRASVSSICSSVGSDIEDLIIAISKTAYINVASASHSDQVEPVAEALETDEMPSSENLHRKLSSDSASSSIGSSYKLQASDDDDDDFTLTDTSNAGTEIDTKNYSA
ncbi:uncharacterized protein [Macrobrachium rosenbergii]|uniref:uncharacterized protein n=1 Tax=Macrobrachium rosenbergii TaxID=79674 RepID=UPI0034D496DF